MIETKIREVITTVEELGDRVTMLYAPEGTETPYAVYTMSRSEEEYILDGTTGNRYVSFDVNIYAKSQVELKNIQYKLKNKFLDLLGSQLGDYHIQDVRVDMSDFYDSNVELSRGVLEIEIYI